MKRAELNLDKVKELYLDRGMSINKCAKELGVNQATLNKYLTREGIKKGMKKEDVPDLMASLNTCKISNSESIKKKEKSKSPKRKPATGRKSRQTSVSIDDKIIYCNNKYGFGCWRFMDKDELRECLLNDWTVIPSGK